MAVYVYILNRKLNSVPQIYMERLLTESTCIVHICGENFSLRSKWIPQNHLIPSHIIQTHYSSKNENSPAKQSNIYKTIC